MGKKAEGGPKETGLDKELARIGAERYERYVHTFVPLEKRAIYLNTDPNVVHRQEAGARGMANANYQQRFGEVVPKLGQVAATGGENRLATSLGNFSLDKGKAIGLGLGDTNLASLGNQANNLQSLINIGQGKASGAIQGLSSAADVSNKQSIMDARAEAAARAAVGNAVGTGVGMYAGNKYFNQPQSGGGLTGNGYDSRQKAAQYGLGAQPPDYSSSFPTNFGP